MSNNRDREWLSTVTPREYDAFKDQVKDHYATKAFVLKWLLSASGVVIVFFATIMIRLFWFSPLVPA